MESNRCTVSGNLESWRYSGTVCATLPVCFFDHGRWPVPHLPCSGSMDTLELTVDWYGAWIWADDDWQTKV